MLCKHTYFQFKNGELVCSVCGKLASELKPPIEDKVAERTEIKMPSPPRIVPKGVKKVGRPKRR